jgi:hypothetical protein
VGTKEGFVLGALVGPAVGGGEVWSADIDGA